MRFFALLLALLLGLAAPVAAQDDSTFLSRQIESALSGAGRTVTVSGFQGALSSRARVAEITIADDEGIWLTARDITLDWTRTALLLGRFSVNEFSAAEIVVSRRPVASEQDLPSAEAQPFSLPDLPVSVNVGSFRIDRIELAEGVLGPAAALAATGSANLASGEGSLQLTAERIDGMEGRFEVAGSFANVTRQLELALDLTEGPDGIVTTLSGIPGAPALEMSVQGAGSIDDFTAELRLATQNADRLAGTVSTRTAPAPARADGTVPDEIWRHVTVDLGGDLRSMLPEEYREFFGPDMSVTAEAVLKPDGAIDVDAFAVETAALALDGRVVIALTGVPGAFDITGTIRPPAGTTGPVLLPFSGGDIRVDGADLAIFYDSGLGDEWRADVTVSGVSETRGRVENLRFTGSGEIVHPTTERGREVSGQLTFQAAGIAPVNTALARALGDTVTGRSVFTWRQGDGVLRLPVLALDGGGFSVAADATVAGLTDQMRISGSARASLSDAARFSDLAGYPLAGAAEAVVDGFYEPLSGMFDGEASLRGRNLSLGQIQIDRMLAGESSIDLSARRDLTGTQIRRAVALAQAVSVEASGHIRTGDADISATLDFTDAGVLGDGYGGALRAEARLRQSADGWRVTFDASGTDMAIGQPQVDALLEGQATVALSALVDGSRIEIERLEVAAPRIEASASGTWGDGSTDLSGSVDLRDAGALGAGLDGSLQVSARAVDEPGGLRVIAEGSAENLGVGNPQASRLLRGTSLFSAEVLRGTDGFLRVDGFDFRNPQVTATASGSIDGATRRVVLDARLADLALLVPGFPGPVTASGEIVEEDGRLTLDMTATGPGGIDARANGWVALDFGSSDVAIAGSAQLGLANAFISPRSVQGPVSFDLRMQGAPGLPALSGTVSTTGARFVEPGTGLVLEDVQVTAALSNGSATISGGARGQHGGDVTLQGTLGLAAPFSADLAAQLNGLRLVDASLYDTRLTGRVTVTGPLTNGGLIAGLITLSDTEIRVPTSFAAAGEIPPDMVHRAEPRPVRDTRARAGLLSTASASSERTRPLGLDLTISAPNRVFVRGRGLDAELGGEIHLGGTLANIVPSGQFDLIRGRLDFLDRRFDLTEGTIQLQGSSMPYVRFVASSTMRSGMTANIVISGDLSDPEIEITSNPQLPEEEILSQIIFGRDLSSISPLQAAQLASAVATLAGTGGEGIVSRLRRGFGLDNLDVVTDDEGNSAVRAGRYISENLYTEVIVGSRSQSEISLNLDVTPSLTLRGRVTQEGNTGIGIFFDRDY